MINKCIIPVINRGDKWLPISEFIPGAMFPIMNYPLIHYTFQEVFRSGLNKIAIVITSDKEIIRDYIYSKFSGFIGKGFTLEFIYQEESSGTGNAIMECKDFIQDEPFAVVLPEDLYFFQSFPLTGLMDVYSENEKISSVLALTEVNKDFLDDYPCFNLQKKSENLYIFKEIFSLKDGPVINSSSYKNSLRMVGRYIFSPAVLEYLQKIKKLFPEARIDEDRLFNFMLENQEKIYGVIIKDKCFDISRIGDFVTANHTFYNF